MSDIEFYYGEAGSGKSQAGLEIALGSTVDRLRLLIERIETLSAEKQNLADDIKDVFSEAKSAGFDTKAMKEVIKLRKKAKADRDAEEAIIDTYKAALGL
jgi:uncharacterized protein (UPF0335 family)